MTVATPRDYAADANFVASFRAAALAMAQRKSAELGGEPVEGIRPSVHVSPTPCSEPIPASALASAGHPRDVFAPLPPNTLRLSGELGRVIRTSIDGWILGAVPYHDFSRFFREGRPQFAAGEMWGKFVRSGCMMFRAFPDPAIQNRMRQAVAEILSTERANGSISCTSPEAQPDGPGGDLWERKYVLLGLLEYYAQIDRDPAVLDSMRRQADAIIAQIGPAPKSDVRDLGWSPNHVESSTLLEPIMRLHALTGESRYLDFARYLVDCGGAKGSDLVQMALENVPPHLMGGSYPKAYEITSYFEGLSDYFRATGDERVRKAVLNYFMLVRDRELTIVGNGGADQPFHPRVCGEAWSDTAREQTNPDITRMMETCTGVTWMKFCTHILRLTGDCTAAEAIEKYVYNGLVGAMKPDGTGFSYVNLLDGVKTTNSGWGWDFDGFRVTCCNLNGPLGLAYIPYVAVMQSAEGPVVNLYTSLNTTMRTPSGTPFVLSIETDYPISGHVRISVSPAVPEIFTVRLRIPAWSAHTSILLPHAPHAETPLPGRYLELRREWHPGDIVELDFEMRCRRIEGPHGVNRAGDGRAAVAYGPIVLTRDEHFDSHFNDPADIAADADGTVVARRIQHPPAGTRLAFDVSTREGSIFMTDYASADCWSGSRIRTWIEQRKSDELNTSGSAGILPADHDCAASRRATVPVGPRIATGGKFTGHFLWDAAFSVFWAVHASPEWARLAASTLDNLYRFAEADGYIGREFLADGTPVWDPEHPISFNPPMLAWAELELAGGRSGGAGGPGSAGILPAANANTARLARVYPALVRHHRSCARKFRRPDGLYFGCALGCGMDDLPRWPHGFTPDQRAAGGIPLTEQTLGERSRDIWTRWLHRCAKDHAWNRQAGWIDMSAAMALDARSLAEIAARIGRPDDARAFTAEHAALADAINRLCWDEKTGFYYDVTDGDIIPRRHLGALWVLVSHVAPPARVARMMETLFDPAVFYRTVPLASLEAGDPDYTTEKDYFKGPAWPNLNFLAIRGLCEYGHRAEAEKLARRWYNCCAALYEKTGGIYENLSSEQFDHPKERSFPDYAGHGCLTPVALPAMFGWGKRGRIPNSSSAASHGVLPSALRATPLSEGGETRGMPPSERGDAPKGLGGVLRANPMSENGDALNIAHSQTTSP